MNKAPILFLLLLAAAAGVWLLVNSDGPQGFLSLEPEDPIESLEAVAPDLADVVPASGSVDEPDDHLPGELPEGLRSIVEVDDANDRFLVVQVWDGRRGVPAPAAEVFVLDGFAGEELEDPFAQHWSDLARRRGQRFRADEHGRVELPPVRQSALVTARLPGAYGFAKVGREHRDVETITLRPDETVTVRVTDGQGRAVAGVPVGVIQRVPERRQPPELARQLDDLKGQMRRARTWLQNNPDQRQRAAPRVQGLQRRIDSASNELRKTRAGQQRRGQPRQQTRKVISTRIERRARRRTDEDGIAVFRHFQVYRHRPDKWWPADHTDQFEAVLLMPLQQPESRAFAGRPVPEQTIELRMPETGNIVMRTIDRDGRPFTHPVRATLRLHNSGQARWSRVHIRKEQDEEAIVFPFVGLGLQFTANCRLDDEDFKWQAPPFAGPSGPGQRVTIDLVVAPGEGMLFGRLLDSAGEPLASIEPTFLINSHTGRLEGEQIVTDRGGRFHLPYQARNEHLGPFRFEVRYDEVTPTLGLAMSLPLLPRALVTDLGDLRVSALGPIAHGFVVDDRGAAIEGAVVQLQREREVRGEERQLRFADEAFNEARTAADGSYALFADLEPGRYRLRAQAEEHFPFADTDLRRGQQQDLRMLRRSRLLGTALTPEWMKSHKVRTRLVALAGAEQPREDQVHDHKGKTYIFYDWVKPGLYDLTLRVRDFPDPFLRIDRLEIEPGQMHPHARLRDLDLSAYLSRFEVFALDQQGQRIQPNRPLVARITRPNGKTGHVGFPWRDGRVEILGTTAVLEVWPMATGYSTRPATLGPGRNELQFLQIPPVDVQLAGMRQLAGQTNVQVVLELLDTNGLPAELDKWDRTSGRISGWYARARYSAAMLGDNDIARIQLMRGGRHRVIVRFGGRRGQRPPTVVLGQIDVRLVPGAGPERVTVDFEPGPVQQALAEVAQRQAADTRNSGR